MKISWRDMPLYIKLNLPIQLVLLAAMLVAHLFVMDRFESEMLSGVESRIKGSATQSLLALNTMMLNGSIRDPANRAIFLQKMSALDGVEHFHLIRADAVRNQFGPGLEAEQGADDLDRLAATSGLVQTEITRQQKPSLRVVVPFTAKQEFYGTDCLQCHHVPEGAVLGTVSLTLNLESEYAKLRKIRTILIVGQVLLQVFLLLLIGRLIRGVIGPVVDLKQVMSHVGESDDFSMRAQIFSKDEVGQIAHAFNKFLGHIEELHQRLAEKIAALQRHHDKNEEDQRITSIVMSGISDAHSTPDPAVRLKISPAGASGGDIILVSRTPAGNLHVVLADVASHGMVAAMNLLPLSLIFDAMSKKGFPVSRIVEEINSKIHNLMPTENFIGAAVVSVDFRDKVIEVWNGGVPAPVLVGMDGEIIHKWPSYNLPLGILNEETFSSEVEVFHYDADGQLFLFSNGLLEAQSPGVELFGNERIEQIFRDAQPEHRFDRLLNSIESHMAGHPAHDDISLAVVNLSSTENSEASGHYPQVQKHEGPASHWKIAISLGENELKCLDTVPLLYELVCKIHTVSEHHSALYVILSELFNNALDHGILELDSSIKYGAGGFDEYLCQRESKLHSLVRGSIDIEIEKTVLDGRDGVRMRVVDSGSGFDYTTLSARDTDQAGQDQYGRGIILVKSLASKLVYAGRGNDVTAYYIF